MSDHEHNPDSNENARVTESIARVDPPATDIEAAWLAWSIGIQKVDERAMKLVRAAFEAGFEAGAAMNNHVE